MRKWIIYQSRDKGTSVMEVEIEMVRSAEDPSVGWLPEGEYKARIMQPKSLYEKQDDGSLTPPMWYSHAFYWNENQAWAYAERMVRDGFERDMRKLGIAYTEQQIQEKLATIKQIKLP